MNVWVKFIQVFFVRRNWSFLFIEWKNFIYVLQSEWNEKISYELLKLLKLSLRSKKLLFFTSAFCEILVIFINNKTTLTFAHIIINKQKVLLKIFILDHIHTQWLRSPVSNKNSKHVNNRKLSKAQWLMSCLNHSTPRQTKRL